MRGLSEVVPEVVPALIAREPVPDSSQSGSHLVPTDGNHGNRRRWFPVPPTLCGELREPVALDKPRSCSFGGPELLPSKASGEPPSQRAHLQEMPIGMSAPQPAPLADPFASTAGPSQPRRPLRTEDRKSSALAALGIGLGLGFGAARPPRRDVDASSPSDGGVGLSQPATRPEGAWRPL